MKVEEFTDAELATCVDEFVKRVHRRGRIDGYDGQLMLHISGYTFSKTEEFKIVHSITVGPYDGEVKVTCDNALTGIERALSRLAEDKLYEPRKVALALPAPAPTDVEYADFVEVPVSDLQDEDDIPY